VIVGLGLDLVDVSRMAGILASPARAERFLARVFTPRERAFCDPCADRPARYAARFAAKEACLKALGVPVGLRFMELEVVRGEGAPTLALSGNAAEAARRLGVSRLHLTITHDRGVAAAAVVAEGEP